MDVGLLSQYIMNGLMLGMMYTLVAVGFTLFFGVLDIIKFSHGDVLTVGAFTGLATYIGLRSVGVSSTPLLLLAVLVVAIWPWRRSACSSRATWCCRCARHRRSTRC